MPVADVFIARIGDCAAELFPQEQAAVSRAMGKRHAEFAAGRSLARTALAQIGHPPCAIPQTGRAPLWPVGVVGSITHNDVYVAACAARQHACAGIGIDIEAVGRVTDSIESRILTAEEIGDTTIADSRTLRFACKEAVYKAVNPIVGEFFGFQAVSIVLDAPGGSFTAKPERDGAFAEHVANGRGVFVQWRSHHLVGFYLPDPG